MGKMVKVILKIVVMLVVLVVTFFAGAIVTSELHHRFERRQIYAPQASRMLRLAQELRDGRVKEAQVWADSIAAEWLYSTVYDVSDNDMAKLPPEVLWAWQEAKEYFERYDVNDAPYDSFATVSRVRDKLAHVPWSPMQAAKREFKAKYGGGKLEKAPRFEIKHWLGQPVSATNMEGKVILLDFWNIYCKPCVKSLPKLQAIYEEYGAKGLVVIGLAGGEKDKTAEFLKKHGYMFPVGVHTRQTWLNFAIEGVPSYFMIDKQGRLAWGPQHELPDANEIEALLTGKPHTSDSDGESIDAATPGTVASGSESSFTIKDILAGLSASQAHLSTLQYEYEIANEKAEPNIRRVDKGKVARAGWEGSYFHDRTSYSENINTGEISRQFGYVVAFDGTNTFHLDKYEKQNRAVIASGRLDSVQEDSLRTPEEHLWEYVRPFSELLADANSQFQIVGQESINGINAIKITGSIKAGKFKSDAPMSLGLSPKYNCLPLKVRATLDPDRDIVSEYYLSDLLELPDGVFFPQTITFVVPDSGTWRTIGFKNISTAPIPDNVFHPKVPRGTHVTDHISGSSYTAGRAAFWTPISAGIALVCIGAIVFEIVNLRRHKGCK